VRGSCEHLLILGRDALGQQPLDGRFELAAQLRVELAARGGGEAGVNQFHCSIAADEDRSGPVTRAKTKSPEAHVFRALRIAWN